MDKPHDTPKTQFRQESPTQQRREKEIVRSAELSSRFFYGWGAASYSLHGRDDLWSHVVARSVR